MTATPFVLTADEIDALREHFRHMYLSYNERGRVINRLLDRLDQYRAEQGTAA